MRTDATANATGTTRWECREKGRYYLVMVQENLFGETEVMRFWGGIGSLRGGQRVDCVANSDAAQTLVAAIAKRRAARGYRIQVQGISGAKLDITR